MRRWIVVRSGDSGQVGFVRMAGTYVVVTEKGLKGAKRFGSENEARGLAWELNTKMYGSDVWTVMEIKEEK